MTEPPTSLRVLVVEDEYYIADDLRRGLEGRGAQIVGPTPSVRGALDILAGDAPVDVAVLDISLQDGMVWPLARALRDRRTPFVFATGYSDAVLPPELRDVPLFRKPVEMSDLTAAILKQTQPAQGAD